MSDADEGAGEGGRNGPPEDGQDGAAAIAAIARHLAERAISSSGELSPDAEFQVALRSDPERAKILEQLTVEVCPNGIDFASWIEWIKGGKPPFAPKLKKLGTEQEGPSKTLICSTPRVRRQEKKIEQMRADLEAEERQLAVFRAFDNAAVHWLVIDQLIGIMSPVFAMGPAWTVMRSISGYTSDELIDKATRTLMDNQKEKAAKKLRDERKAEAEELQDALDFFSGYQPFENKLRDAILEVVRGSKRMREELAKTGRKSRSEKARLTEVHPQASADAAEVLQGLARDQEAA